MSKTFSDANQAVLFSHYIQCPYKAYLTSMGQAEQSDALEFYFENQREKYRQNALLQNIGTPSPKGSKQERDKIPIEFSNTNKIDRGLKLRLAYQALGRN